VELRRLEITVTAFRLCAYTAGAAGVAVLAHTDGGTIDYYIDGNHHENLFSGVASTGGMVRLRSRSANYYELFDLLGPMPLEMLSGLGEKYTQLVQARLNPEEMDELLKQEGC
jgi:hypothetical protein